MKYKINKNIWQIYFNVLDTDQWNVKFQFGQRLFVSKFADLSISGGACFSLILSTWTISHLSGSVYGSYQICLENVTAYNTKDYSRNLPFDDSQHLDPKISLRLSGLLNPVLFHNIDVVQPRMINDPSWGFNILDYSCYDYM